MFSSYPRVVAILMVLLFLTLLLGLVYFAWLRPSGAPPFF